MPKEILLPSTPSNTSDDEQLTTEPGMDSSTTNGIIFSVLGAFLLLVLCVLVPITVVCGLLWKRAKMEARNTQTTAVSNPVYEGEEEINMSIAIVLELLCF